MKLAGYVVNIGDVRNSYRILVGKPKGKRPDGRRSRGRKDNIEMDLEQVGCESMDWIHSAQDRVEKRDLVKMIMNLRVP
jgi:hypothetical protein